jgi:V8-like Glu-specific endopeptidase
MFRRWYESLQGRDPRLFAELSARFRTRLEATGVTPEAAAADPAAAARRVDFVAETIVREGRPALAIRDDRIVPSTEFADGVSREMMERLLGAAAAVESVIPLVGRVDVVNFPGSVTYLGTGWLVDRNVLVTNRHVAELFARRDGGQFVFRPGRFGERLSVSVDYRHELGSMASVSVAVRRVIWIEPDPRQADIAFLEVDAPGDGTRRDRIALADADAAPDTDVAVIGYPARAPADVIPDQAWMDRIYSNTYDVKRVAPGLMGGSSRGWATHDCTTLGGNSGSVVVELRTGRAVALHFAGLYMIENYAVPASTVRRYLRERPWQGSAAPDRGPARRSAAEDDRGTASVVEQRTAVPAGGSGVSVVVPLTISISLGQPAVSSPSAGGAGADSGGRADRASGRGRETAGGLERAARELARAERGGGVLAVRPGYAIDGGRLTDEPCLVVAAHPAHVESVRRRLAARHAGYAVDVRPASVQDQLAGTGEAVVAEAVTSVRYNDDDRTGEPFSLDWIDEDMRLVLHVGPERSWKVLAEFLAATREEMVSSIYEFHAGHIARAVERELDGGGRMTLVLARQSRDPSNNRIPKGDFDRSRTFERWAHAFGDRFERIFVPTGSNGLVATSYHIKVTVRDRAAVWLSSGNWKQSSQPLIDAASLDDPRVTGAAGNREWHVVAENRTLAGRLRNHILADYEQSGVLGGTLEAVEDQVLVDVPRAMLEAITLEAPPAEVVPERPIQRRVRLRPLLTPDRRGGVYGRAVLQLIRSARRQLLFQIPYISIAPDSDGLLVDLVEALIERSQEIDDTRLILRSDGDGFWDHVSELKRRGLDVDRRVRRLPRTHTKGMVVDGRRVLVGSHNWSMLGVTLNRDASLLIDDEEAAEYFGRVFEIDWDRAGRIAVDESVVREVPRLAEGAEPPPGFVRMPLADYLEG